MIATELFNDILAYFKATKTFGCVLSINIHDDGMEIARCDKIGGKQLSPKHRYILVGTMITKPSDWINDAEYIVDIANPNCYDIFFNHIRENICRGRPYG